MIHKKLFTKKYMIIECSGGFKIGKDESDLVTINLDRIQVQRELLEGTDFLFIDDLGNVLTVEHTDVKIEYITTLNGQPVQITNTGELVKKKSVFYFGHHGTDWLEVYRSLEKYSINLYDAFLERSLLGSNEKMKVKTNEPERYTVCGYGVYDNAYFYSVSGATVKGIDNISSYIDLNAEGIKGSETNIEIIHGFEKSDGSSICRFVYRPLDNVLTVYGSSGALTQMVIML